MRLVSMDLTVPLRRVRRPASFESTVLPHYAPLVRRLTLVLSDPEEAQDIAQSAYLRAYRAWDRFDGHDARAWLYTIGLRLAFNERRRRSRETRSMDRPAASWDPDTDADLWQALQTIEPMQRSALLLQVLDGYTHAEIGRILDAPPGTVASWISRAKARLRADLAAEEGEA